MTFLVSYDEDILGEPAEHGVRTASRATGLLRVFNEAGVIVAADVHVALRLGRLSDTTDEQVLLAVALAVRAPRLRSTCVDLSTISHTADADVDVPVDVSSLPWPAVEEWVRIVGGCALVGPGRPLELEGSTLYLNRYWSDECAVAADLLARAGGSGPPGMDEERAASAMERAAAALDGIDEHQKIAVASALTHRFTVVAGGPGTGKTTTIARLLAVIDEAAKAAGSDLPMISLGAPTGKAASRLQQAVRDEAASLRVGADVVSHLCALDGKTIQRLLLTDPSNHARFRHNRTNPLPSDVVVIDETSMVPLSVMARLLEAVRPDARLILVGDPDQLASVEAGAVLGDVLGPASHRMCMRRSSRESLERVAGVTVESDDPPVLEASGEQTPIGDGAVLLSRSYRFDGAIAELAAAIREGDADRTVDTLSTRHDGLRWLTPTAGPGADPDLTGEVRTLAVESLGNVVVSAQQGDVRGAVEALGSFRLLCAHRRGPAGAYTWAKIVESWLVAGVSGFETRGLWYVGRPLLVTANDYATGLYNGDTGVVIAGPGGLPVAAFDREDEILSVSPSRLESVETVYAMTVHKSQGSQFDAVALVLPEPDSPILTRELLYTAVTRARTSVVIAGSEESLRTAVERPVARSSGLRKRLWGP